MAASMGSRLGRLLWIARLTAFVASGAVFAASVWYAWTALMLPLEIEIREGSVWIVVLAKRAGVDAYDSSRVAFANMNHGPMDAVLKGWIGTHFPSLPGHLVIRTFVFLMPFFLLGAAYYTCRRSWTTALLAAGALHLLFVHITLTVMLGRTDATFLCAAAIGFALTHALLVTRHRNWSNGRSVALQVLLGACGAVMFLTTWRVFPTIGVMVLLTLAKQVAHLRRVEQAGEPEIVGFFVAARERRGPERGTVVDHLIELGIRAEGGVRLLFLAQLVLLLVRVGQQLVVEAVLLAVGLAENMVALSLEL